MSRKTIVFIEVQIVIILIVIGLFKINNLEKKVYNTNAFVYKALVNKRLEQIKEVSPDDIVIGDKDAPVTFLLYSSYNCSACNSFYNNIYHQLVDKYVATGEVKVVVRNLLIGDDKELVMYASKAAKYAYNNDIYEIYHQQINSFYPALSKDLVDDVMMEIGVDKTTYRNFMDNPEVDARLRLVARQGVEAGVVGSPIYFVNDIRMMGSGNWTRIEKVITTELSMEKCE